MNITAEKFQAGVAFVQATARDVDKALLAYHLQDGPATAVLDALTSYQNPDGGFGRALEPDFRLDASSPMATSVALQYCQFAAVNISRNEYYAIDIFSSYRLQQIPTLFRKPCECFVFCCRIQDLPTGYYYFKSCFAAYKIVCQPFDLLFAEHSSFTCFTVVRRSVITIVQQKKLHIAPFKSCGYARLTVNTIGRISPEQTKGFEC